MNLFVGNDSGLHANLMEHAEFTKRMAALQQVTAFRIRYKRKSSFMWWLNLLIGWFSPGFLDRYTTVIGRNIYLAGHPDSPREPKALMGTLLHEMVHQLDAQRSTWLVFALAYLFPQILGIGVLAFPWIGWGAGWFLLALGPWPAPGRVYVETRAYAIDYLRTAPAKREQELKRIVSQFTGWGYYKMCPCPSCVSAWIRYWARQTLTGQDRVLAQIWQLSQQVEADDALV